MNWKGVSCFGIRLFESYKREIKSKNACQQRIPSAGVRKNYWEEKVSMDVESVSLMIALSELLT